MLMSLFFFLTALLLNGLPFYPEKPEVQINHDAAVSKPARGPVQGGFGGL